MRLGKALLIARKDLREALAGRATLASLVLTSVMMVAVSVIVPASMALGPDPSSYMTEEELEAFRAMFPEARWMDERQMVAYSVSSVVIPFIFMVSSLAATSILTADSFAGEKERKTIEALLAAPVSDSELFMGKVLASFLPALASLYASFGLACLLVNLLTAGLFGYAWFPPLRTALIMCLLTPAYMFLGMCLVVLGSARASTVKDASNYAAILLLPLLAFFLGQVFGGLVLGMAHLALATVVIVALDVAFIRLAKRAFDREKLIISS